MKFSRVIFSLATVLSLLGSAHAQDQKKVLFETFTNSFSDECPKNNDFDAAFRSTMSASNAANVIHLNYHIINYLDPMQLAGSPQDDQTMKVLSGVNSGSFPILFGAVDRTNFPPLKKITHTTPGGKTEWDQRIVDELKIAPTVSIKLISAQIDTLSSSLSSRFIAYIDVTSSEAIADTLSIHYAITEDNVAYAQCPDTKPVGPTHHNDIVRYITQQDSLVNLRGKPSGSVSHVTYIQDISKKKGFILSNLKFIAFVQDHKDGDFQVVQSALLQKNFKTLSSPPASLTLNSALLDGQTKQPGDPINIIFDKVSIDSVKLEFSPDGGTTWQFIANSHEFNYYWSTPELSTTQAMIRISDLSNGSLKSVEKGMFAIQHAAYGLIVLHPNATDTVFIGKKFTITWNSNGVDSLYIDYSSDGGTTFKSTLARLLHGEKSYVWNVPTTTAPTIQGEIKLRSAIAEANVTVVSEQFIVDFPVTGSVHSSPDESFSISVNPQPVKKSERLNVNLKLDTYSGVDIALYDLSGKKVLAKDRVYYGAGNNTAELQLNSLPSGTYVLEVRRDNGEIKTLKIEVQ